MLRRDGTKEFVLSIKGTPWSPDGERAGDVNIRVDLAEARGDRGGRIRQILTHQSSPEECASPGRCFERFGLAAQCSGCRAIRTGIGHPANHTDRCRERIEQELEKEPPGSLATERELSEPGTRSEPET